MDRRLKFGWILSLIGCLWEVALAHPWLTPLPLPSAPPNFSPRSDEVAPGAGQAGDGGRVRHEGGEGGGAGAFKGAM